MINQILTNLSIIFFSLGLIIFSFKIEKLNKRIRSLEDFILFDHLSNKTIESIIEKKTKE